MLVLYFQIYWFRIIEGGATSLYFKSTPVDSDVTTLGTTVVVQLLSCVQLFVTPWTAACQASLFHTISRSLPKFMSVELVMLSNHLILCCPLLLLPLIFPNIRVFTNVSALYIRRSKYWSFSISPSNEYSGLISFRIDWFDLLAVQVTLMNLLHQLYWGIVN